MKLKKTGIKNIQITKDIFDNRNFTCNILSLDIQKIKLLEEIILNFSNKNKLVKNDNLELFLDKYIFTNYIKKDFYEWLRILKDEERYFEHLITYSDEELEISGKNIIYTKIKEKRKCCFSWILILIFFAFLSVVVGGIVVIARK